jgi:hypothetical protein
MAIREDRLRFRTASSLALCISFSYDESVVRNRLGDCDSRTGTYSKMYQHCRSSVFDEMSVKGLFVRMSASGKLLGPVLPVPSGCADLFEKPHKFR